MLTTIVTWWVIILIFGLAGWPLAFSLMKNLPERGFAFARPVGFLFVGYILWLGATFRLLQNNAGGILVALGLVAAIGLVWQRQQAQSEPGQSLLGWLKQQWRYVLAIELLFNLAFVGWVIFKAYNPNIETAGGEKWMEIAFINGILRSDYFPPQDPWLSDFGISYYYFGYVMMAAATQLTGLISTVAFNLYIPTLFAMTLAGAFGIVANLVTLYKKQYPKGTQLSIINYQLSISYVAIATGLIGAVFVAILGNLIGVLEVLHKRGLFPAEFWIWLDIRNLKEPPIPSDSWIPDRFIWWWRGSRVLTDYTLTGQEQEVIDEFPFFSFMLGDVHPHVLALPFVLLVIALALNVLANPAAELETEPLPQPGNPLVQIQKILKDGWQTLRTATGGRMGVLLYAIAVGGLSFLNTWDFPIYLSVVGLALITWLTWRRVEWPAAVLSGAVGMGMLGVAGVIFYLLFYATFQSQARGILPNLWNPTRLPQFLVFFGPFLVAVIVLLIVLSRHSAGWRQYIGWSAPFAVLGPALLLMLVVTGVLLSPAGRDYFQGILNNPEAQAIIGDTTIGALLQESLLRRAANPWTFLLLGGLVGWVLALLAGLASPQAQPTRAGADNWLIEKFVLILVLVGLGLPLVVEFVYLRDNFGIRMNTIFKFYFQAWVLLALASAFAIYYVSVNLRLMPALMWQAAMVILVAGGMVYPILATLDKTNYFQDEPTLNGIAWISKQRPGDYAAIAWLRDNAFDDAVVLEAPGSGYAAYQYTGRVSAMTGLPTLLGWGGHQSQWRGNYDEPARREPDIDLLFNTSDIRQAQELLDKYNIMYVYVGPLERERYSPQGLNKFEKFMNIVFQQDDVTIYKR
jgi:YYY domain-containing protein